MDRSDFGLSLAGRETPHGLGVHIKTVNQDCVDHHSIHFSLSERQKLAMGLLWVSKLGSLVANRCVLVSRFVVEGSK